MTKKRSPDKIVDGIAHFTGHSERDALESSLTRTLYDLLNVERVNLFKITYEYNIPNFHLAIELDDNGIHVNDLNQSQLSITEQERQCLLECFESGQPKLVEQGKSKCAYLHPVINFQGRVSGIFCLCGHNTDYQANKSIIEGYFRIYNNYIRLLDESEHDSLTGLLNRRTFDKDLDKTLTEWHQNWQHSEGTPDLPQRRAEKSGQDNWLAEIDIDFFKRINDEHGHLHGDSVLIEMSNLMQATFRNGDKLFRFGGEEFVVILRNTNKAGAKIALDRFMSNLKKHKFPRVGEITVSIGGVQIANETVATKVLGRADDALYFAKQNGRDQICWHDQLIEDGILLFPNKKHPGSDDA